MKAFHILLILISPLYTLAQLQKTPTVEVKGEARLKVKPDQTVVTVSFNAVNMEFNKAVKAVNDKNEILIKQLEQSGFKKEEIKSSSFTANKNIIWSRDRSIDSGYVATQTVILEFAFSKERVGKLIDSFSQSTIGLNFNFDFTLSESKTKETKKQLIELAINDAKEKAKLIAKSSDIKLDAIQLIQYGINSNMPPQPMYKSMAARESAQAGGFSDLNVVDIELSDEVMVSWAIKP